LKQALFILEDDSVVFKYLDHRQTARAFIKWRWDFPEGWKYCLVKLRGQWYHFINV